METKLNNKGFSLIEMIVASVILSLSVVSICAVGTRSIAAVRSNRNYEIAWDLLDRQLTMIDYFGVEEFINEGRLSGHFGDEDDENSDVHYWSVEYEECDYDNLYKIRLTISWQEGGRARNISASTMLNGSGILTDTEEDEESEEGSGSGSSDGNDNQPGGGR